MKPERKKCEIITYAVPVDKTAHSPMVAQSQCSTHQHVFQFPTIDDRCPIGRLEDVEARLDSIEDQLLNVTRALTGAR